MTDPLVRHGVEFPIPIADAVGARNTFKEVGTVVSRIEKRLWLRMNHRDAVPLHSIEIHMAWIILGIGAHVAQRCAQPRCPSGFDDRFGRYPKAGGITEVADDVEAWLGEFL